jgi:hypothetical protein
MPLGGGMTVGGSHCEVHLWPPRQNLIRAPKVRAIIAPRV